MIYYSAYSYSDNEWEKVDINQEYIQVNGVGSYELKADDYCVTKRKHGKKDFLLIYTYQGTSMVQFADNIYEAGEGTVYLYRPNEAQFYGQIKNTSTKCYWICFSGYGTEALLKRLNIETEKIMKVGTDVCITSIFQTLIDEILQKQEHYEIHTSILIQSLLFELSKRIAQCGKKQEILSSEPIRRAVHEMNKNYMGSISIKDMAEQNGLSVSRFIQLFRAHMGKTPKEYLISIRLDKACEFLRYTNLSIKEIAAMAGFEDALYFSRVFHKYRKQSPTEYRKTKGQQGAL